jgi:hypothetical protein
LTAPVDEQVVTWLVDNTRNKGRGGRAVTRLACAKALAAVFNDKVSEATESSSVCTSRWR